MMSAVSAGLKLSSKVHPQVRTEYAPIRAVQKNNQSRTGFTTLQPCIHAASCGSLFSKLKMVESLIAKDSTAEPGEKHFPRSVSAAMSDAVLEGHIHGGFIRSLQNQRCKHLPALSSAAAVADGASRAVSLCDQLLGT